MKLPLITGYLSHELRELMIEPPPLQYRSLSRNQLKSNLDVVCIGICCCTRGTHGQSMHYNHSRHLIVDDLLLMSSHEQHKERVLLLGS